MISEDYQIILFYKYVYIDDPEAVKAWQMEICANLNLKGRCIIASEGVNATFEGTKDHIQRYITELKKDKRFLGIHFKLSDSNGNSFPKLSIKVRKEIVSLHLGVCDIDPNETTGVHLKPEELHKWLNPNGSPDHSPNDLGLNPKGSPNHFSNDLGIKPTRTTVPRQNDFPSEWLVRADVGLESGGEKKEFYIVDMRNAYEHKVGYFENSILPPMENFRDLPKIVEQIAHLKNKTVLTVCTGGVRCEKASGFLIQQGFTDVYQLDGGIVSYMEKYPNEDFKGKLYVFDGRVAMGPSALLGTGLYTDDPNHQIIAICDNCEEQSENYVNCANLACHRHFIACHKCVENKKGIFCPGGCTISRHGRSLSWGQVKLAQLKRIWYNYSL